jgi:hypothetical protein
MRKKRDYKGDFFEEDESEEAINNAFNVGIPFSTMLPIFHLAGLTCNTGWTEPHFSPFPVTFAAQVVGVASEDSTNRGNEKTSQLA